MSDTYNHDLAQKLWKAGLNTLTFLHASPSVGCVRRRIVASWQNNMMPCFTWLRINQYHVHQHENFTSANGKVKLTSQQL